MTRGGRFRRPQVVLMLREPRAGRVKTRLGRMIGMTAAAWWFRHQSSRQIRVLTDPRWDLVLAITPDRALRTPAWPMRYPRYAQGPGDLGDRMLRMFRRMPPGPVIIVGADVPAVTAAHIWRAIRRLDGAELVIGPSADGGYWLIGMNRLRWPGRAFFRDVRWSTRFTRTDTLYALRDRRIVLTDTLEDIDSASDLRSWQQHIRMVGRPDA